MKRLLLMMLLMGSIAYGQTYTVSGTTYSVVAGDLLTTLNSFAAGVDSVECEDTPDGNIFSMENLDFLIPDENFRIFTFDVPEAFTVTDLNVYLNISCTWSSDLEVWILPPSGAQRILLLSDNGGGSDDIDVTLDQQATAGVPSRDIRGTFSPSPRDVNLMFGDDIGPGVLRSSNLDNLNGEQAQGRWMMLVGDDFRDDVSTAHDISLIFERTGGSSTRYYSRETKGQKQDN